jgi:hypothetical protein
LACMEPTNEKMPSRSWANGAFLFWLGQGREECQGLTQAQAEAHCCGESEPDDDDNHQEEVSQNGEKGLLVHALILCWARENTLMCLARNEKNRPEAADITELRPARQAGRHHAMQA